MGVTAEGELAGSNNRIARELQAHLKLGVINVTWVCSSIFFFLATPAVGTVWKADDVVSSSGECQETRAYSEGRGGHDGTEAEARKAGMETGGR